MQLLKAYYYELHPKFSSTNIKQVYSVFFWRIVLPTMYFLFRFWWHLDILLISQLKLLHLNCIKNQVTMNLFLYIVRNQQRLSVSQFKYVLFF